MGKLSIVGLGLQQLLIIGVFFLSALGGTVIKLQLTGITLSLWHEEEEPAKLHTVF